MEANKTGRVLAPVSQYEGKLAVGTLYASKRLIDTDPNTVRAFVTGWIATFHNGASVHERCHQRYCLATAGGLRYPNPPYR